MYYTMISMNDIPIMFLFNLHSICFLVPSYQELIVDLGIFSKESARQLMEYASKGPNTRFYEAVQRAYRPTAKQVPWRWC